MRPRAEAYANMGKPPSSVKLVDVNQGDDDEPNYRSRFVAREIRLPGEASIFAPTPPLEALRTVLSMAATDLKGVKKHVRDGDSEMRTQVAVIDISRVTSMRRKTKIRTPLMSTSRPRTRVRSRASVESLKSTCSALVPLPKGGTESMPDSLSPRDSSGAMRRPACSASRGGTW